jgi:hypothetical protein
LGHLRGWLLTVCLAALVACAERPPEPDPGQVRIAPDLFLVLPSPASLGRRVEAVQLVVARYGARTLTFEGRISAAPDHFDLVSIDPLGRTAMRIHWTNAGVAAEKADFVPDDLRAENMLADLVMLYWPAPVVARALIGGSLTEAAGERAVRQGGADIIRVLLPPGDAWNGKVSYRNQPWDYALEVQSRIIAP